MPEELNIFYNSYGFNNRIPQVNRRKNVILLLYDAGDVINAAITFLALQGFSVFFMPLSRFVSVNEYLFHSSVENNVLGITLWIITFEGIAVEFMIRCQNVDWQFVSCLL